MIILAPKRMLVLACICLFALGACRRDEDRAYSRGSTVTIAVSDVSVLLPDETDADFLVFLPVGCKYCFHVTSYSQRAYWPRGRKCLPVEEGFRTVLRL